MTDNLSVIFKSSQAEKIFIEDVSPSKQDNVRKTLKKEHEVFV